MTVFLTLDEVLEINVRSARGYGGAAGLRDRAALEASISQPKMCVHGQERFSTLVDKAGAYCYFIVCNHPFIDGNKRTGFLAALHFLLNNGAAPEFDEDRTYTAILGAATGRLNIEEFLAAFRSAMGPGTLDESDGLS